MDLPAQFYSHIKDLGYTQDININDITQVSQGVMKPIIQFLMLSTQNKDNSLKIRANLDLNENMKIEPPRQISLDRVRTLKDQAAENHIKINRLKSILDRKIANYYITKAYSHKIQQLENNITGFRDDLKPKEKTQDTNEADKDSITQISESLLYISNETKTFTIPAPVIHSLYSTFNIKITPITLFPVLLQNFENFRNELIEKIHCFDPDLEFSGFGLNLKKKSEGFEIDSIEDFKIIDSFSKEVQERRKVLWEEFIEIEGVISDVLALKNKFQQLFSNKKFYSSEIKNFYLSEVSKFSKKAELVCLKEGLAQLESIKLEKENQGLLSAHHKTISTSESLISKISQSQNTGLRRELLKKKLQTDEFIKKHLLNLRQTLPETLKPMYTGVSRELQEYTKVSHLLYPNNIPNPPLNNTPEQIVPIFTDYYLNKKLLKVSKLLRVGAFCNKTSFIESSQDIYQVSMENPIKIELLKILPENSYPVNMKSKRDTEKLKKMISQTNKNIQSLDEEYSIWESQPAQHTIPWRKDHLDLNISEALELWKTSVINR
jgi:hypothetical protein